MNRLRILAALILLGPTGFCQTADTSSNTPSSGTADLSQYRLEAVRFEGSQSSSPEQLKDAFNVLAGNKFNKNAVVEGLDRLRQLYGDNGYLNFTAVPTLELDKDRGTVALTISIEDGPAFKFGQLYFEGQETQAGKADTLRNAWAPMSGKRYDASLLRKWLTENATFLPNDGQPLRHVEMHLDVSTHQADLTLTFP